jgi:hypothetical protein
MYSTQGTLVLLCNEKGNSTSPDRKIYHWAFRQRCTSRSHIDFEFLRKLCEKAASLGIPLTWADERELQEKEPHVKASFAVFSQLQVEAG